MDEVLEVLEGCVAVLRDVDESSHDPRLWVVMEAIAAVMEKLDEK